MERERSPTATAPTRKGVATSFSPFSLLSLSLSFLKHARPNRGGPFFCIDTKRIDLLLLLLRSFFQTFESASSSSSCRSRFQIFLAVVHHPLLLRHHRARRRRRRDAKKKEERRARISFGVSLTQTKKRFGTNHKGRRRPSTPPSPPPRRAAGGRGTRWGCGTLSLETHNRRFRLTSVFPTLPRLMSVTSTFIWSLLFCVGVF